MTGINFNLVILLLFPLWTHCQLDYKSFDDAVLYKINWKGKEGYDLLKENDERESMIVTTADKEKYKCILPTIKEKEKDVNEDYDGPNPVELLMPLFKSATCNSKLESYWTYEICHGRFIRQFHEDREGRQTKTQEYILGHWDKMSASELSEKINKLKTEGTPYNPPIKKLDGMSLPYLELNFTDGTVCDLSGTPRYTNVLYICYAHGKNEIYSIKETSTCVYEAIILSPSLCKHPKFKPKESGEHDIDCLPLEGFSKKPRSLLKMEVESLKQRFHRISDDKNENVFAVYSIGEFTDKDGKTQVKVELRPLEGEELEAAEIEHANLLKPDLGLPPRTTGASSPIDPDDVDVDVDSNVGGTGSRLPPVPPVDPSTLPIPIAVQNFLSGKDCLRGGSPNGWWKYKFCYGDYVEQYHMEKTQDGMSKTIINLGSFDRAAHIAWIRENPHKRPKPLSVRNELWHFYGNGDHCEKTGRPRETEVKLKCIEKNTVTLYLLEPQYCRYTLGVESPLVCDLLDKVDENGLVLDSFIRQAMGQQP